MSSAVKKFNFTRFRALCRHRSLSAIQKRSYFEITNSPTLLSPLEVNKILRANEYSHEFAELCPIQRFDTNFLAANNPIEDRHVESVTRPYGASKPLYMFSVIDGHAGPECANLVSGRLHQYLTLNTWVGSTLEELKNKNFVDLSEKELFQFHMTSGVSEDPYAKALKEKSVREWLSYVMDLYSEDPNLALNDIYMMGCTFKVLDETLMKDAAESIAFNEKGFAKAAASGACCCTAVISHNVLKIASIGDCFAVLGTYSPTAQQITAVPLTMPHNSMNTNERNRVISSHPSSEEHSVIRSDRLLSCLLPFRAFGDVNFKWSLEDLERNFVPLFGNEFILPNYKTPPYLIADPEVVIKPLEPNDLFLVIGSDGLSDSLTCNDIVTLISRHIESSRTLKKPSFCVDKWKFTFKEIEGILSRREEMSKYLPEDSNCATHLLRHALGCSNIETVDKLELSMSLSNPNPRSFRDDISIIVIYFNDNYLREANKLNFW